MSKLYHYIPLVGQYRSYRKVEVLRWDTACGKLIKDIYYGNEGLVIFDYNKKTKEFRVRCEEYNNIKVTPDVSRVTCLLCKDSAVYVLAVLKEIIDV